MKSTKKVLFFFMLICLSLSSPNAHAFFFGDSNVDLVKEGTLNFDNSITLEEAFEGNKFLQNPEWKSFKDGQGRTYVQFSADVDTNYVFIEKGGIPPSYKFPLQMKVQFVINKNDTFEIKYLTYIDSFGYELYKPHNMDKLFTDLKAIYQNNMPSGISTPILNIGKSPIMFLTNCYYYNLKENNFYERIKNFVEQGADIDSIDKQDRTPLLDVIRHKDVTVSVIDALLRNGANVNSEVPNGSSVLMYAIAFRKNLDIIQLLLDYGANVNTAIDVPTIL